jgi:16S rRNA (guanine966-N2)-methyltransferase
VRVIAGRLGGRLFDSPGINRTHPMSEKMCGALFNILGDIEGLTVLDAFAGTGALSFEACSRGAKHATAIEADQTAAETIARNIEKLDLIGEVTLVRASNQQWMQTNEQARFDIVLCDPPYDNSQPVLIKKLADHVAPSGILVLSWPADDDLLKIAAFSVLENRAYGNARLVFYRR